MGSPATLDAPQNAVIAGLYSDDPLVRLLARENQHKAGRIAELEADEWTGPTLTRLEGTRRGDLHVGHRFAPAK
jgi:hypothetical protein